MIRLLAVVLMMLLAGCASTGAGERPQEEGVVEADGRIDYIELEGGFYGITTDAGARYYPVDLPEEYMRDGIRIRFRGRVQEDMVTIQMWGTPVAVEWVEAL